MATKFAHELTQEQSNWIQPKITKAMHGLEVQEKQYIIRKCIRDHFYNIKNQEFEDGQENAQGDKKNSQSRGHFEKSRERKCKACGLRRAS